ncbi:MAG: FCD domain-containing protein, partial [Halanaerobiales bacterium]|nr:FCD domain-containing protein [Halanaerobiales bacterium]
LTEEEIRAIYVVRANLEGLAGQLFAQNASKEDVKALLDIQKRLESEYRHGDVNSREKIKAEFYATLMDGAKNDVLREILRTIHARIAIFRRYAFIDSARIDLSMQELNSIIDAAARDRNAKAAWAACEKHIDLAGDLAIIEYGRRIGAIDRADA